MEDIRRALTETTLGLSFLGFIALLTAAVIVSAFMKRHRR